MKTQAELYVFFVQTAKNLLEKAPATTKPIWGRMDMQQMIEHLWLALKMSTGKIKLEIVTPADKIEKVKLIALLSNRPLPKGFQNVALPVEPIAYQFLSKTQAIEVLFSELDELIMLYEEDPNFTTLHNLFGPLNLNEWLWFHYKHFMHHLSRFGLVEEFTQLN